MDFPHTRQVPATEMVHDLIGELSASTAALDCSDQMARLEELIEIGTGARRQHRMVAGGKDLRTLVVELAAATHPDGRG